jgi:hypothetical protein
VQPIWELVAECYLSDLSAEGRLAQAALTPYHEIRVIDAVRPGAPQSAHPLRMNDAIARIRQAQTANHRTTPVIVRCTNSVTVTSTNPTEAKPSTAAMNSKTSPVANY